MTKPRDRGEAGMTVRRNGITIPASANIRVVHTVPVSGWCPRTHNPLPGSVIDVEYTTSDQAIDVYLIEEAVAEARSFAETVEQVVDVLRCKLATSGVPFRLTLRWIVDAGSDSPQTVTWYCESE